MNHYKHLKIAVCFACLLCSCVPITIPFEYISLTHVEGMMVKKHGESQQRDLWFHHPVPIAYVLSRGKYKLQFLLMTDRVNFLGVTITPLSLEKSDQVILVERYLRPYAYLPLGPCGPRYLIDEQKPTQLWFEWGGGHSKKHIGCPRMLRPYIAFDVLDGSGNILGQENIQFEVKTSGFIIELDGL